MTGLHRASRPCSPRKHDGAARAAVSARRPGPRIFPNAPISGHRS